MVSFTSGSVSGGITTFHKRKEVISLVLADTYKRKKKSVDFCHVYLRRVCYGSRTKETLRYRGNRIRRKILGPNVRVF